MKSGENVMDMEMKMSKVIEDKSGSGSASASPLPKLISSRSPSDLNNHKPLSQEMTRTLKEEETEASRKKALTKMPSEAELEDFFSAAEKYEQNRFAEKYNYDIVKDVPLEGRYEWKKNNITYPTKGLIPFSTKKKHVAMFIYQHVSGIYMDSH
ncbi:hypothetical protein LIER_16839 [Lithospermum erythrorhizon]|uniref:Cyclin-dependent kinase inhibitor domain-containing protein n=1 Tax=Lithospermum erythrorhizon TaxID=34254 RepID=A0AAV3QAL4_LITER